MVLTYPRHSQHRKESTNPALSDTGPSSEDIRLTHKISYPSSLGEEHVRDGKKHRNPLSGTSQKECKCWWDFHSIRGHRGVWSGEEKSVPLEST